MSDAKQKVRTRPNLPAAMKATDWLTMVLREKPAVGRLGAVAFNGRTLSVIAWLTNRVVAVPMARAAVLRELIREEDRPTLDGWLAAHAAGDFAAREAEKVSAGW